MMAQYIGEIGSTDAQSVANMLQTFGQIERQRRERQLTDMVLTGVAAGKDFNAIMADVQQTYQGQGPGEGIAGLFQGIAGRFMPPSPTMQILANMGLAQATPQKQAELQATQAETEGMRALTKQRRIATRKAKAHEQIDFDQAGTNLRKTRAEVQKMKRENDPAWMEADYYSNLAVMQLNRLRHVDPYQNEKEYGEALRGYDQAIEQMEQAWQRWQGRKQSAAPGEAPPQGPGTETPTTELQSDGIGLPSKPKGPGLFKRLMDQLPEGGSASMLPPPFAPPMGAVPEEEGPASAEDFYANVERIFQERGEAAARRYYERWKGQL